MGGVADRSFLVPDSTEERLKKPKTYHKMPVDRSEQIIPKSVEPSAQ
jgi:hypothetical protein